MLHTELNCHLGYEKWARDRLRWLPPRAITATATGSKKVIIEDGPQELAIPRERLGTFDAKFIKKGQSHSDVFDRRIFSMRARGMTLR